MKRSIWIFILIFNLLSLSAQERLYRERGKSRIMTEAEFENIQAVLSHRLKSRFPDARTEVSVENKTIMNKDTIFDVALIVKFEGQKSIHFTNLTGGETIFSQVGKSLPDFKLKSIDGKTYTKADFNGKPILLNYWLKTCGPCKAEMPALNKLKEKYDERVYFIAITPDTKEEAESVLEKHPFHFLQLIEAKELIEKLGLTGAPKNIFIDKNGTIYQVYEKVDDVYDTEKKIVSRGNAKEFIEILDKLLK